MVQLECLVHTALVVYSSPPTGGVVFMENPSLSKQPDPAVSKNSVSSSYPWYVFGVMFAISFFNYLDRYVLSGAATTIAHELGFGIEGIGTIASAFLIVYTLFTIP